MWCADISEDRKILSRLLCGDIWPNLVKKKVKKKRWIFTNVELYVFFEQSWWNIPLRTRELFLGGSSISTFQKTFQKTGMHLHCPCIYIVHASIKMRWRTLSNLEGKFQNCNCVQCDVAPFSRKSFMMWAECTFGWLNDRSINLLIRTIIDR